MKKLILTLFLFSGFFANSQYCTFFDFEAKEPEMVVSTLAVDGGQVLAYLQVIVTYSLVFVLVSDIPLDQTTSQLVQQ